MAGLTLGGLASGMDTDAIVSQLMSLESVGKTRLLGQQYQSEARKTALDSVATKLRALKTATDDLRSVSSWKNVQSVDSSDAAKIGATFKTGGAVGSYSIEVTQLARADQQFFTYNASAAPTTFQLKYAGAATGTSVNIAANATADDVAAAINGKADSPAFASVVDGQVVLSGKKTGVDLQVTAAELTADTGKRRASRPALYTVDGVQQAPSLTNTVTNGLSGVDLQLKSLTTSPVTISIGSPGPDQSALKSKVKAFVDAYNSTIDLVKGKLEETPVKSPTTQGDYGKGVLRGDPGLSGLLSKLRSAMGQIVPGDPAAPNPAEFNSLSDLGVSVPTAQTSGSISADRLAGKLTIDDTKLTAALTADPTAVRRLFGGVGDIEGITQRLDKILDPVSRLGDGDLAKRSAMIDGEVGRIKDQQTLMDQRLKLKEERLRKQFTAMETALSSTQSTTSWLSGQIAGLSSWS
jgi:flagellar hook-associated protein 2